MKGPEKWQQSSYSRYGYAGMKKSLGDHRAPPCRLPHKVIPSTFATNARPLIGPSGHAPPCPDYRATLYAAATLRPSGSRIWRHERLTSVRRASGTFPRRPLAGGSQSPASGPLSSAATRSPDIGDFEQSGGQFKNRGPATTPGLLSHFYP